MRGVIRAISLGGLLSLCASLGGCASVRQRDDATPSALLQRAIDVAGGRRALSEARALRWEGSAVVHAGGRDVAIRGTWAIQPPDSAVVATWDTTRGPTSVRRLIVAGRQGWMERGGTFTPMPAAMLAAERDEFYLYDLMRLVPLTEPGVELRALSADSAGNEGFEVVRDGRPPVSTWFSSNGRLAHLRLRIPDAATGGQATQDLWLDGTVEASGIRWPRTIRITMDGAPYFDLAIEQLTVNRQLVEPHLSGPSDTPVEATSLLGEPLARPVPDSAARIRMEAQLAEARRAWERAPNDPDSIIWLGRRTAYLGRFSEAIAIYSDGIARHPTDARLYRHRGHRYLTTRQLDRAIADLQRAYDLTKGKPDEVEPDGMPNARNIPTSTLQGNIRYHLALAHYLKDDFDRALPLYREDVAASTNPDMLVATSHWLYMTLRRLGRANEAAEVLAPISRDMDIIENGTYHRLLLLYRGELAPEALLPGETVGARLDDVTTAYGVANWHLYNGRRAQADALLRRILDARSQWPSFGFLAAEAEMSRKRS